MARVELSGKPIIITGASSGIGAAAARACARAGMPVVLAARRVDKLDAVRDEIERAGGKAIAEAADVTDPEHGERLMARCEEAFGGLYAVYANAGYGVERSILRTTDEELRAMFETNFFGTMHTIRPILPRLVEQKSGHVVICSSSIGKIGIPHFGGYCATKGAQWLVGQAMRNELKSRGVRVSTVHPVGTKTEFFETAAGLSGGASALESHAPEVFMQSSDTVARSIVRALRTGRPEVWPAWARFVQAGIAIGNIVPRLCDQGLKKIARAGNKAEDEQAGGSG